jgi:hypothetical protein
MFLTFFYYLYWCKDWETSLHNGYTSSLKNYNYTVGFFSFAGASCFFISADPQLESRLELLMPAPPSSNMADTV